MEHKAGNRDDDATSAYGDDVANLNDVAVEKVPTIKEPNAGPLRSTKTTGTANTYAVQGSGFVRIMCLRKCTQRQ